MTDQSFEQRLELRLTEFADARIRPVDAHATARAILAAPSRQRAGLARVPIAMPRVGLGGRILAVGGLLLLVALLNTFVFGGGPVPPPSPARTSLAPSATVPSLAPPSASPTSTPFAQTLQSMPPGDTRCAAGLMSVAAGGSIATSTRAPSVPSGAREAFIALGKTDKDGSALEAGLQIANAGSVKTIATVTSGEPFGGSFKNQSLGYASIKGWSADGGTILLWAGRWSPSIWYHECSDLWLVRTDGSSVVRLTDNRRPGAAVWGQALAPDGSAVALFEADPSGGAESMREVTAAGVTTVLDTSPCGSSGLGQLIAWSPDSRQFAMACDARNLVFDVVGGPPTVLDAGPSEVIQQIAWTAGGTAIEAAVDGSGFRVASFDLTAGLRSYGPALSGRPDLFALGFSADGSRLLVYGCPATPNDPACFDTDLEEFDPATGAARSIWSGPKSDASNTAVQSARWRTDGRVVLSAPAGSGTLVIDAATGHATHDALPIDAALWLPRP